MEDSSNERSTSAVVGAVNEPAPTSKVATRYELQMSPAAQRSAEHRQPEWSGAAMVVGDNPIAKQLEARLRSAGVPVNACQCK